MPRRQRENSIGSRQNPIRCYIKGGKWIPYNLEDIADLEKRSLEKKEVKCQVDRERTGLDI